MFGLDSILGGAGDIAGYFAGSGDRNDAMNKLERARLGYEEIDPTIAAQETGPSAFNTAGQDSKLAQEDVLSNLRNKYQQGGLDALDRARLAEINQSTAQAGRSASEAAKDDAARRGMLNSATSLVAQQTAGQNAAQVGATQGVQAAGEAERARRATLGQAGFMAGEMRGQDYHKAAAQDAIARFNAAQRQGAEQQTVGNKLSKAGGVAGVYGQQYGAKMDSADRTGRLYGGVGRMFGSALDYNLPKGAAGGGGGADPYGADSFLTNDMTGGAAFFAEGGTVPGEPVVPGDSPANDTQTIQASPGEVVIPRSIAELLRRLLVKAPNPAPNSSPSVFDAKAAMDAHNRQLEQALEGAR